MGLKIHSNCYTCICQISLYFTLYKDNYFTHIYNELNVIKHLLPNHKLFIIGPKEEMRKTHASGLYMETSMSYCCKNNFLQEINLNSTDALSFCVIHS